MKEITEYSWTQKYRPLPEREQLCWPCRQQLERLKPKPGTKTWRCPTCDRHYSDIRMYSGMGAQKPFPAIDELERES